MAEISEKRRVLSGMRPTGRLHLGNYMGALYNWVRLQQEYACYFFIADIHALTTDYADPSRIQRNTMEIALDFLSAGLDPEQSTIFIQSHVPQHAELHLLLSMITTLGWLERVPTYKDQQEQLRGKNLNTYGFLGYPLLQSADILLYRPDFVPVGEDQVSHVELTREIARRFNQFYGGETYSSNIPTGDGPQRELLPEPRVLLTPSPKLPGLDGRKMSKSYGNFVSMSDPPLLVLQKMSGMSNGGQRLNQSEPGDPDRCPVGQTHAVFSEPAVNQWVQKGCRSASIECANCKLVCGSSINQHLHPIRQKREELIENPQLVLDILDDGAVRARSTAETTLKLVHDVMGIGSNLASVAFAWSSRMLVRQKSDVNLLDLSEHADWWEDHNALRRGQLLRDYWLRVLPDDYALSLESGNTFISRKGKRVLVTTSRERDSGQWTFRAKPKTYEVMVLLCWQKDKRLRDFVIPQSLYVKWWTALKKAAGKEKVEFAVTRSSGGFFLQIGESGSIDLSEYASAYKALR